MESETTIVKKANKKAINSYKLYAQIKNKPFKFRRNAEDYITDLPWDQSRRFKYNFDKIANHVTFQAQYIAQLFQPSKESSSLLDIGSGPGLIAKELLPYYKEITTLDCDPYLQPYLLSLSKRCNFSYIQEKIQIASFAKKYTTVLCAHTMYYIPQSDWKLCINKMLNALEPGGSILIIQTAPEGPMHEMRVHINPNYPHSGYLQKLLKSMNLNYSTETFIMQHPQPSRQALKDIIHMYIVDSCYTPMGFTTEDIYNNLPKEVKRQIDYTVNGFVSGCYNIEENKYILKEVIDYIKIDKQANN